MFLVAASMNPATAWSTTLREGELDMVPASKTGKDACYCDCCLLASAARAIIVSGCLDACRADESSVYLARGTLPLSELQATEKIPFQKAAAWCSPPNPSFRSRLSATHERRGP